MIHPEKRRGNLKKIPMKPKIECDMDALRSWWYICPICHDPLDYKQSECGWCHQKIDWEGEQ